MCCAGIHSRVWNHRGPEHEFSRIQKFCDEDKDKDEPIQTKTRPKISVKSEQEICFYFMISSEVSMFFSLNQKKTDHSQLYTFMILFFTRFLITSV